VNRFDTESAFYLGFQYLKMYVENFFEPVALLNVIQKASAVRNAFKSHRSSYSKNLDDIFKGMNSSDDLADAWKNGWTKEQVLAIPKGSRPNPNVYLKQEYIDNHLAKFDGGVVKISPSNPTGNVGPPSGTFVLPKQLADDLITQAGGDVGKLEEFLGLDAGYLGTNPYRIDILNPTGLRMSTGNELGANSFWLPGGKTSGGILEATVDQIPVGSYTSSEIF
jgi:hypothetical protein